MWLRRETPYTRVKFLEPYEQPIYRYPIAGRVAWVNPARAGGNRTQGVGIQFPKDEKSVQLRAKIESILGSALGSDKPTQTL